MQITLSSFPMIASYCCIVLALLSCTFAYNAPASHVAEEMRFVFSEFHTIVDNLVWENAFKWSNAATGTINFAVLAQIQANFTEALGSRSTSTFRQCDRLTAICYQCENGAANVSAASTFLLPAAKLYGQSNNVMDSSVEEIGTQTYTLYNNNNVPVWTASLACRANATCFPASDAQLIRGELQGARKLTFKKENGQYLIHRINTGARYTYFPAYEAGLRVFTVNHGQELVPDSILEDFDLTGIFCFPSKRSVAYYTHRGLPLVDEPY